MKKRSKSVSSRNESLIIKSIKKPLRKAKRKTKVIKQNGNLQDYFDVVTDTVWLLGALGIIIILFEHFYN